MAFKASHCRIEGLGFTVHWIEGQCGQALSGELAPSGGVEDRLDRQSDITVVDAGDGVAETDRCLVSEAGGGAFCALRPSRAARQARPVRPMRAACWSSSRSAPPAPPGPRPAPATLPPMPAAHRPARAAPAAARCAHPAPSVAPAAGRSPGETPRSPHRRGRLIGHTGRTGHKPHRPERTLRKQHDTPRAACQNQEFTSGNQLQRYLTSYSSII